VTNLIAEYQKELTGSCRIINVGKILTNSKARLAKAV